MIKRIAWILAGAVVGAILGEIMKMVMLRRGAPLSILYCVIIGTAWVYMLRVAASIILDWKRSRNKR
jgi:ABC-type branched-subunit amino acid transport system permease subunit